MEQGWEWECQSREAEETVAHRHQSHRALLEEDTEAGQHRGGAEEADKAAGGAEGACGLSPAPSLLPALR